MESLFFSMLSFIELINCNQNDSGKKTYEANKTNNIHQQTMSVKRGMIGLYLTCMAALMRYVC